MRAKSYIGKRVLYHSVQLSSVAQSCLTLCDATRWIAARQASLSITSSQSSPKPMSIESVMPSSHLILCRPLLLLPSIFPSIRVFSNESTLCMRYHQQYETFSQQSYFWDCSISPTYQNCTQPTLLPKHFISNNCFPMNSSILPSIPIWSTNPFTLEKLPVNASPMHRIHPSTYYNIKHHKRKMYVWKELLW